MKAGVSVLTREALRALVATRAADEVARAELAREAAERKKVKVEAVRAEVKEEAVDTDALIQSLAGLLHPEAPPQDKYKPLEFLTPTHLLETFSPEQQSTLWQTEVTAQIAGFYDPQDMETRVEATKEDPMIYTLVAANGSGKDSYIVAPTAVWFACTKIRSRTIITGAKYDQLKGQTFTYIKDLCLRINEQLGKKIFDVVEFYIHCLATGSEIRLFVTDDAGKAEGFHPFPDYKGSKLLFIANEAKSIPEALFTGFERYTITHRLDVSSPGACVGHFYRQFNTSVQYPAPMRRLSEQKTSVAENVVTGYARKITAFECPHIPKAKIERILRLYGANSLVYRSSILAEFTSIDDLTVINREAIEYKAPAWNTYGLPKRAGLDLSLGGDETVLSIWHGNKRLAQVTWRERDEPTLHGYLIQAFQQHGLKPENIFVDAGGIGLPIIQRLRHAGWDVVSVKNEGRALDSSQFTNRAAENWFRVKRLVEEKILIIPHEDATWVDQLTTRLYRYSKGKVGLEDKKDARKRGAPSPDRADATVLAFALIPLSTFFGEDVTLIEEEVEKREIREMNQRWTMANLTPADIDRMQEIYAKRRTAHTTLKQITMPEEKSMYPSVLGMRYANVDLRSYTRRSMRRF